MSKLIESNEFGDWLIEEIAQTRGQLKSLSSDTALAARLKLGTLKTAKETLLEFLKIQQKMFDAASAARRKNQDALQLHNQVPLPHPKGRRGRYTCPSSGSNQAQGVNGA
jgi:hypothetical protein